MKSLDEARAALVAGDLVAIFPEGRLTVNGQVDQFKHGFERVAQGTNCPVIPVYLNGLLGHPLTPQGGSLLKGLRRPVVTVRAGEPADSKITADELRESVLRLACVEVPLGAESLTSRLR